VLSGSSFADAATPANYPYLVGQLLDQGTLLSGYTALDGYELAGDAALLPGGIGARLSIVSEPGCGAPPGATSGATPSTTPTLSTTPTTSGAPCTAGSPPSPPEVDAFLQRVVGPILSSPAYREDGLVAITFSSSSNGAEGPGPTLALQPAAGTLLLSPLLHGGRSSTPFNALAPRQSLEAIFKH
jgi:hypothetical protein